jgi:hypothetical protein
MVSFSVTIGNLHHPTAFVAHGSGWRIPGHPATTSSRFFIFAYAIFQQLHALQLHLEAGTTMIRARLIFGALVILAVAVLGCSKNSIAPAKVSGSVSYKGQPIKGGTMQFHGPDGVAYNALLSSDGTYTATDIPEGELVVTIETESANPAKKTAAQGPDAAKRMSGGQKAPEGRGSGPDPVQFYTKIPAKFANAKTSPITVTVKSGRQVKDIELTD